MSDTSNSGEETESESSEQIEESVTWKAPGSQAELDRIIRDRIKRERDKYKDYAELSDKAKRFDELDEKSKSELEKARENLTAAEQRAIAAEEKARTFAIRSAVVAEASKQKAISPEDVYRLLDNDSLNFEDDGSISGVEDAVTALLESKPFLKQTGFTGSADGGSRGSTEPNIYTREQLRDTAFFQEHKADILLAQREGRIR